MRPQLFAAAVATGLTLGLAACNKSAPDLTSPATNAPATPAAAHPELQKLIGKWERPDGGYVLEITSVDAEGKLDARYANPAPIKVSRARAYREGGATKVFVELTDVNYPGCTYQLSLDEPHDQLFGIYFQAALQQKFDVAFARLK
jgi:hypothetical protein